MLIIINELSLAGQFTDIKNFSISLEKSLKILDVLTTLNISISKNQTFFTANVFIGNNLYDTINKYGSNDTIRALRANIVKWCISQPYWDINPSHTCADEYKCTYTSALCNYGLAEAVENDQIVFSFEHSSFKKANLQIQKNKNKIVLRNITQIDNLFLHLADFLKEGLLVLNVANEFFPMNNLSNKTLEYSNYKEALKGLSEAEKINKYKQFGELIARLNSWNYSTDLTRKNNRSTFVKTYGGNFYNLEIDTQHGEFELYLNGKHQGAYTFYGKKYKKAENRTTHYR